MQVDAVANKQGNAPLSCRISTVEETVLVLVKLQLAIFLHLIGYTIAKILREERSGIIVCIVASQCNSFWCLGALRERKKR